MGILARAILFSVVLFFLCFSSSAQLSTVQTEAGKVEGYSGANGITIFKGIPFAAPPVGDLRWKAPQPAAHWDGVKQCRAFGPSPMQNEPMPFSMWTTEFLIPKEPISEDCLYLNVWTGAKSPREKLPVLMWIYGGGFSSGGAACPIYDGEALAAKGIIVVSINYRVGIFGFFAHPELTQEAGTSGNYGLMDQIAALQWIRKNIAAFGGDPANVTIAGQSAGSYSVSCLVASPMAKGLFKKAIGESGGYFINNNAFDKPDLKNAEKKGVKLAEIMGANSMADLRKIPASELLKKGQGGWAPIIDGKLLPKSLFEIFAARMENQVDLLTGWNQDEGILFGPPKTPQEFKDQLLTQFAPNGEKMLEFYPSDNKEQSARSQLELSRDLLFAVQNYTWANLTAKFHTVYLYRFTRKVPATGDFVKYGAFHTGEVPYVFDNLKFVDRPWTDLDQQLAKDISAYWVNFIKTGSPNGKGLVGWSKYNPGKPAYMELGDVRKMGDMKDGKALTQILGTILPSKTD